VVNSIFKGGAIIFLGYIISKLFGLIYRVLVGRYIGPEEYGIIAVMIAVYTIGKKLSRLGIPKGVQKYVAEYRPENSIEKQVGVVRTGTILITISSLITASALFIISPWLSTEIFNESRAIWPIRFAALLLPIWAHKGNFVAVTDAYEKMQYHAYTSQIFPNIAKVILTGIFIILGYGYLGAAAAFAIGYGLAAVAAGYYAYKILPEIFKPNFSSSFDFRKLFTHSWPLFAAGLLASIAGYIDTLMLQVFLGAREVGLYNSAYPFASALAFGTSIFGSIYLSNASKLYKNGKKEEMMSAYGMIVKWTAIVAIPLLAIMLVFPQSLLQIFGEEYLGMANVLRILGLGFLLSALIGPISGVIQAVEKTKYKLYLTVFTGVSNISLNLVLIPIYGVIGAAFATAGTFLLAFIVKSAILYKFTGILPFRFSLLKIGLAGLISGFLAYNISFLDFPEIVVFILGSFTLGVSYLVLLLVFRVLEEEDIKVLKHLRKKTGIESEKIEEIVRRFSN